MSTAESVDKRLADGLVDHLRKFSQVMDVALKTWGSAVAAAETARDRVRDAQKAAVTAQLHGDADEEPLTRRAVEADAEAELADYAARQAWRALASAVRDTECEALRARNMTVGMPADDAARVERMAYVATERARAVREEAGLGPSPEDAERRRCAERAAAQRVAEAAAVAAAAAAAEPVVIAVPSASPVELTPEARVLGLLAQDSTLSVSELARRIGVDRRTLYRWPKVKQALAVRRAGRRARQVRGRSLAEATADDDERPRIARSSRPRHRPRDS
jgi:hypothetical protein